MKALKGRTAITKGVIIFSAIVLALALSLPVLADGPNGHGGKSGQAAKGGQPETRGQSGDGNGGQAGQNRALPDQASSQGNQGQGRSDQAGSRGNLGQGKANPDQAGSQGKGKANPDQAGTQANQGQGQAQSNQATSRGNQGKSKAQTRQTGPRGNKGKAKLDAASSQGNQAQAQGMDKTQPGVIPYLPTLENPQRGQSRSPALQALGAGSAFNSVSNSCNLYRFRGKPQAITFPFSDTSQGGSILTISNNGGLKNLRITVNGQRFQISLDDQAASNTVDVDLSSALLTTNPNSIVFTALGKPGTCAMVTLR